jgi:hypothetical protein
LYPPLIARAHGRAAPRSWSVLSLVPGPHALTRESSDTIRLVPQSRPMLHSQVEQLFRRPPPGFEVGDRITLDPMTVEIVDVKDGHPTAIRVTFDRPIEAITFLIATPRGYVRYPMPPIGTTVTLPPAAFPQP